MFTKTQDSPAENLDKAINTHLASMAEITPKHQEYPAMVTQLDTLYKLRNESVAKPMTTGEKATVVANLAGIVMILKHEQVGVITSKALGFILKLR